MTEYTLRGTQDADGQPTQFQHTIEDADSPDEARELFNNEVENSDDYRILAVVEEESEEEEVDEEASGDSEEVEEEPVSEGN